MRIYKYVDWVRAGQVVPNRHAEIVSDRGSLVVIDGGFGYGQVIGKEAMEAGTARAAEHGFTLVAIRNSGHLGRIGAWVEMLANAGLASFHFVNTSGFGILVAPHGGSDRRLSANPVAAGVPVEGAPPLVLDIATSVIAEGKIQVARNKGEKLPAGMVVDGAGRPTDDPEAFYANPPGAILPFGGHKGSGLTTTSRGWAGRRRRHWRVVPATKVWVSSLRGRTSAGVAARISFPCARPEPARKLLVQPPASLTRTIPAAASQEFVWCSQ